jgi:hypothetical protein
LYRFAKNAPMMVERRWPTWKLFTMFGDEYSTMTFLPALNVFEPDWGCWTVGHTIDVRSG